jgi:hypothetical protein
VNGGEVLVLNSGDKATTGVDGIHSQWNEGPEPVTVIESYDPPLDIELSFTVMTQALASKNLLKQAAFFSDFRSISSLASKPLQLLVTVLAPLGRLVGLARWYASLLPDSATCPATGIVGPTATWSNSGLDQRQRARGDSQALSRGLDQIPLPARHWSTRAATAGRPGSSIMLCPVGKNSG